MHQETGETLSSLAQGMLALIVIALFGTAACGFSYVVCKAMGTFSRAADASTILYGLG